MGLYSVVLVNGLGTMIDGFLRQECWIQPHGNWTGEGRTIGPGIKPTTGGLEPLKVSNFCTKAGISIYSL
jgi:hypothetical protein